MDWTNLELASPRVQIVTMHPNYRFLIEQAIVLGGSEARILDYGCGACPVVLAARSEGIDMVGADIFYAGNESRQAVTSQGLLGKVAFEIVDGKLPFPDQYFDVIVSNQVFEHVQDIGSALDEIRRVLRPGGAFLNVFPSIGVLREGHCGVVFAHWMNGAPMLQRFWLRFARSLGAGYHKGDKTPAQWAAGFSDYLRRFTVYRSMRTIKREHLKRFTALEWREPDYIAFRLAARGNARLAELARTVLAPMSRIASRRLASMVLVAR